MSIKADGVRAFGLIGLIVGWSAFGVFSACTPAEERSVAKTVIQLGEPACFFVMAAADPGAEGLCASVEELLQAAEALIEEAVPAAQTPAPRTKEQFQKDLFAKVKQIRARKAARK